MAHTNLEKKQKKTNEMVFGDKVLKRKKKEINPFKKSPKDP